jgi:hypothetical protein
LGFWVLDFGFWENGLGFWEIYRPQQRRCVAPVNHPVWKLWIVSGFI